MAQHADAQVFNHPGGVGPSRKGHRHLRDRALHQTHFVVVDVDVLELDLFIVRHFQFQLIQHRDFVAFRNLEVQRVQLRVVVAQVIAHTDTLVNQDFDDLLEVFLDDVRTQVELFDFINDF